MTIAIGPFMLDNPVALAPMAGVTDLPFRKLCRSMGAGYVVGEMLASDPSLRKTRKSRLRGVHLEEPSPRAVQIVGWDPATMADAAKYNVDQGASIIDINMGCPAKKVCQRYAGSALLDQERLVAKILEAVVNAVDAPVTLKIRTGVSPQNRNGVNIARIAEGAGIQALAVHGRTRACKYIGEVEYTTIREICNAVAIPVFANGDINTVDQAAWVLNHTKASGVMIGRRAHGAPWFPGQVASFIRTGNVLPAPTLEMQLEYVLHHLNAMYDFYGAEQGVRIARKHIKWYAGRLPRQDIINSELFRCETPEAQLDQVSELYHQQDRFTKIRLPHCHRKLYEHPLRAREKEGKAQPRTENSSQVLTPIGKTDKSTLQAWSDQSPSKNVSVRL
ncbi:MAG: tRNA dihydrouridine synthase DusB [Acidiferrobacterales bacterium]|nr:tRNA dihydrouridine synthase DusB [Acidiferrobacterales bacterium]